ncbi:MAG: diacylglycerol kinase family lipid kinase [Anaerolineae bacterium]|nr:diacylglycerol kinase family lipid kinase [Anaerolineae bacterium]
MGPVKVILNPIAGRGYGARSEAKLCQFLDAEGLNFDLVRTEGPGHAIALATAAANDGFDLVVAAGGDGTTHEVVNGLMVATGVASNGNVAGTLGVIPVGSGSDFANAMGVPPDLESACRQLAQGQARLVDVCRVTVDDQPPRYFDNTVNIGFGGVVTFEARKVKWVRGMALYLPVVLKTVFLSHAPNVTIAYDGQSVTLPAAMICVGNGPREGGGFFSTPDAKPDDGLLDVCIVREMGKLAMLGFVPRFMNGSHVGQKPVTMSRTESLVVTSEDNLIAHVDGEMLCTEAHRLAFDVLPQKLRVWC